MLFIPILLPIITGSILLFLKNLPRAGRCAYVSAILALTAATTVAAVLTGGNFSVLSLGDGIEIAFGIDTFSKIFTVLVVAIFVLCAIFAFEYMKHEENESRFFGFYLIVLGVLIALGFSANLVTMYLCFEFATLTSVPLVLHTLKKDAIDAGLKYLFYSIAGAFLGLFGVILVYNYSSGIFTAGGVLDAEAVAGNETVLLIGVLLMIIGFGAKAGMFPMHSWLSTAHPAAPAPASAVLSGIIAKAGIFATIRIVYYVVGAEIIRGTWLQYTWAILALITVLMGSVLAFREKQIKKRLAFSSVSQISYIMLGLSMLTPDALSGAVMHMIFHAIIKSGLFLSAGAIIYKTGITSVDGLTAIGKKMPITIWCWTFFSLSLIGIPPFCGFISKWYLALGSLDSGLEILDWLAPVILLISALLTAGYLLPITINGFFPGKDLDYSSIKKEEPNSVMTVPLVILAAAVLLLGIFTAPISGIITEMIGGLI